LGLHGKERRRKRGGPALVAEYQYRFKALKKKPRPGKRAGGKRGRGGGEEGGERLIDICKYYSTTGSFSGGRGGGEGKEIKASRAF